MKKQTEATQTTGPNGGRRRGSGRKKAEELGIVKARGMCVSLYPWEREIIERHHISVGQFVKTEAARLQKMEESDGKIH